MRYIRRLERKDVGLDTSMIPLGSCTMKLNAAAEMLPVTWPEFSRMHPFAPREQAEGYAQVFRELEQALCRITGFSAVSLQPNSGAQGEFAGLMTIRAYQQRDRRGPAQRRPDSVVGARHQPGERDDGRAAGGRDGVRQQGQRRARRTCAPRREQHRDTLAALMVTYPSTHGVFEEDIREICAIVHEHGGQVYMDGANMNAQVGLTSPASIGADVCHLNLHKTFAIPHGGGGPGMGPIAVAAHLAPYLPGHALVGLGGPQATMPVSAAPWGSASILLISYGYIRMLGADGMTDATRYAILNANYIKARLQGHYDVLYANHNGRVAHEMIFDLRPFKHGAGPSIDEQDVAKRLMDYGFHAPTVSFPVAGDDDDRADRERVEGGAGSVLRCADRDPQGDPGGPRRQGRRQGQRPEERAAHRRGSHRGRMDASLLAGAGGLSVAVPARGQGLADGRAHRQPVRRSQPDLRVPADRGVRGGGVLTRLPAEADEAQQSGQFCRGFRLQAEGCVRTAAAGVVSHAYLPIALPADRA